MCVSRMGAHRLCRACGASYQSVVCVSFGWVCRCVTQMCAAWLHSDLYGYGLRVWVGVSHGGGLFTHTPSRLGANGLCAAPLAVGYPRGIYDPQNGLIYPSKYPQTTKGPLPPSFSHHTCHIPLPSPKSIYPHTHPISRALPTYQRASQALTPTPNHPWYYPTRPLRRAHKAKRHAPT